ncbi:hypothetical protein [Streptomyces sp. NPDC094149]|uniref:hypothetical protein n=1 Tax=Streptomyces sp. NPDC094149 TaxID=3155079 RepID=UPI00332B2669
MHPDHVGWVAPGGKSSFPNAEAFYGAADWDALIAPAPPEDISFLSDHHARHALKTCLSGFSSLRAVRSAF